MDALGTTPDVTITRKTIRGMKSELAIVSVFSTVLGCLVVNLWLWTLFRAGKKVLRSSSFVIVSVVTALFTVEVLLRIFLYTIADVDVGMENESAKAFAALIAFYFLLPAILDCIFIPRILAFFPVKVYPLKTRLLAVTFPVAMKVARATIIALLTVRTWHKVKGDGELRAAARLTLNFQSLWPLTECVMAIVDEFYATVFLIWQMRRQHLKFARNRGFFETTRRFLIASVTTFALPLCFWIGVLIAISVSARPQCIAYLYISATATMLFGSYFSCIFPAMAAERQTLRGSKTPVTDVVPSSTSQRSMQVPLVLHHSVEMNAIKAQSSPGSAGRALSTKPSACSLAVEASRTTQGDCPASSESGHIFHGTLPSTSSSANITEDWHLPKVSQAGRAEVRAPPALLRNHSGFFGRRIGGTRATGHHRFESCDFPQSATAPPSPTPRPHTGHSCHAHKTSPESEQGLMTVMARDNTSLAASTQDVAAELQAGTEVLAMPTHATTTDVVQLGAAPFTNVAISHDGVYEMFFAGLSTGHAITGGVGCDPIVHTNSHAVQEVDGHHHRRGLHTPMPLCDFSAVRIEVETTTTVDDGSDQCRLR